jgi:1A family penicillin-binding protein
MYRQGKYTKKAGPLSRVNQFTHRKWKWFKGLSKKKKVLLVGGPVLGILIIIPIATYLYFAGDISDMDHLMNRNNTGIVLTDKNGKVFFSTGSAQHHDIVPLNMISDDMEHALVASEDKDFYKHGGFSILSTVRAVYGYLIHGGGSFGGSTITQQLAKITVLSSNRSFLRQYQAFSIAVAIESHYTKDQILDMYLNSVFYGENSFGIEEASKNYFGKSPAQLDLAESSMLVGVLPAPSAYSPISGDPALAKERQTYVLTQMVKDGYITEAQKTAALKEQLQYKKQAGISNEAPHFTEMVLEQLYEKYGEETVTRSGFQVKTTLDLKMQKAANASVDSNMSYIQANGGSNASLVAIDPKTGGIRALVGSADYSNAKFGKVNMATTARQPGSSFKPIYYSDALAKGKVTPTTVLADKLTDFGGGYTPLNADRTFHGNVTVRQALNWSLNIPSVKVMQKEGIDNAVAAAKDLGITTLKDPANYGLSLALGSAEVPLTQMTNAYAAFANQGQQYERSSIESIADKYNNTIFTQDHSSHQAISAEGAFLISNILSDNQTRSRIFGTSLNVTGTDGLTKKVAVKTGTTDDSRDAWTIGYTPNIAVGVWVGNNDNSIMNNGGSHMAGPIWQAMMQEAVGTSNPSFTQPSGVVKATVCSDVGTLTDVFLSTDVPKTCNVPKKQDDTTKKDDQNTNKAKCTITGKENLDADDPNCVVDPCPYQGLENLASNDPKCIDPSTQDTDGDGVNDDVDQCPNTPSGTTVDPNTGCVPSGGGGGGGNNGLLNKKNTTSG